MQKIISTIKECMTGKTCCEETGADCNQGRACPVRAGTHKPAEAVHQIQEPTVNQQLTDERAALAATPAAQSVANADGRFTKNPVTIDAIKWTGSNLREVIAFTDGPPDTRSIHAGMAWEAYVDLVARDGLKIYTLEGKMLANIGDWIIRGIKGEYYPCKPDIFEATYTSAPQAQEEK